MRTKYLMAVPVVLLAMVLTAGAANAAEVAHWPLDDTAKEIYSDSVGTLDGSAAIITSDSAVGAGCLQVGGDPDKVSTGVDLDTYQKPITMMAWIKPDAVEQWGTIVGDNEDDFAGGLMFFIDFYPPDQFEMFGVDIGWVGMAGADWEGETVLGDGEWHHVAWTCNGARDDSTVYLDGEEHPDSWIDYFAPEDEEEVVGQFFLGFNSHTLGEEDAWFEGLIDDVRIFDTVLSEAQVAEYTNNPPPIDDDQDGLSDEYEDGIGTDPQDPDTDGDGMNDGLEVWWGSDPLNINDTAVVPIVSHMGIVLLVSLLAVVGIALVLRRRAQAA
jgi:hypothetical protein